MYLSRRGSSLWGAKLLLVGILCLGIFFRFVNLDTKVFWVDEVATALRVSGYTMEEMAAELIDGPAQTLPQLQRYQYPNPEKTLSDTATSLAAEDVHPPLFFWLLRLWVSLFGNSVAALRSLAAVFGVLMFPAVWWLCRELFTTEQNNQPSKLALSNLIGWVAVALIAISPVQVVFAQESRQYTLWMLLILLASATLLRSLRKHRWYSWAIYGGLMTLGLYTHYLFALIIASHGLYVLCTERLRPTRNLLIYLLATALAGIGYLPWLLFKWRFPTDTSQLSWMDQPPNPISMAAQVTGILSRSFVDLGVATINGSLTTLIVVPLILLLVLVCLVAIVCLVRQTPFRTWFFVAALGGINAAVIVGSYFVLNKEIAASRFFLPLTLSLQLTVAYLLVAGIQQTKPLLARYFNQPILWRALGGALLSMGVVSCLLRLNAPLWWTQMPAFNEYIPAIAQSLSQEEDALVIMDSSRDVIFFNITQQQSLLHTVDPNLQMEMQLVKETIPNLTATTARNTFLYLPIDMAGMVESPEDLQAQMSERYSVTLEPVVPGTFWRVVADANQSTG